MIRKLLIVVLTLAAVATGMIYVASFACRAPSPTLRQGEFLRPFIYAIDCRHMVLSCEVALPGCVEMGGPGGSSATYRRGLFESFEVGRRALLGIRCCRGRFAVSYVEPREQPPPTYGLPPPPGWCITTWDCYARDCPRSGFHVKSMRGALWLPLLLFAAYPTIAFIRGPVRRWRRGRKGHCRKCGYDLTGNVSGVCPECGEAV
jgi:hypothetical protein